jgi:hypothetical protein
MSVLVLLVGAAAELKLSKGWQAGSCQRMMWWKWSEVKRKYAGARCLLWLVVLVGHRGGFVLLAALCCPNQNCLLEKSVMMMMLVLAEAAQLHLSSTWSTSGQNLVNAVV